MATIRDHRSKADVPVPRGTYTQAKAAVLGVPTPQATASVLQRVRANRRGEVLAQPTNRLEELSPMPERGDAFTRPNRLRETPLRTGAGPDAPVQQSTVNAVPGQPPGFGLTLTWIGDEELAVVAFISASDLYGIGVAGVTDGDTFEVVSAVGNATFSQDTQNEGIAGLVTIVAAGAGLTAAAFGAPELAPLINGAGQAIAKQFPEQKTNSKSRDVYGQIAGSDEFARQEGGLIVCSPDAQGIYESGDGDHKNRWIKSGKNRSDANRPDHVVPNAFFLQRDREPRHLHGEGDLIISPWDHAFGDNVGAYRVNFILRRSDPPPVVIL